MAPNYRTTASAFLVVPPPLRGVLFPFLSFGLLEQCCVDNFGKLVGRLKM